MRSARAVFRVKALTSSKDGSPQPRFGGVPKTNRAQRVPFAAAPCGGRQVRRQAAHRSSCRRRRTLRFVRWRFFAGFGPRTVSCDSTAARRRPGRRAATHVPLDVPFRSARAETRSDAAPTARRFLAEACTLPAGSLPLPPLDDKSRTASPLPSARPSPLASAAKSIAAARSKDRQRRLLHA